VWESESHLFDATAYDLHDVLANGGIVATGEWGGVEAESRTLHVEITYKPEAPVSHVEWPARARDLSERTDLVVSYCDCNYSVVVHESDSHYNMASVDDAAFLERTGKCFKAFRFEDGAEQDGESVESEGDAEQTADVEDGAEQGGESVKDAASEEPAVVTTTVAPETSASTSSSRSGNNDKNNGNNGGNSRRRGGDRHIRGVKY
jgi:hypothetical protein